MAIRLNIYKQRNRLLHFGVITISTSVAFVGYITTPVNFLYWGASKFLLTLTQFAPSLAFFHSIILSAIYPLAVAVSLFCTAYRIINLYIKFNQYHKILDSTQERLNKIIKNSNVTPYDFDIVIKELHRIDEIKSLSYKDYIFRALYSVFTSGSFIFGIFVLIGFKVTVISGFAIPIIPLVVAIAGAITWTTISLLNTKLEYKIEQSNNFLDQMNIKLIDSVDRLIDSPDNTISHNTKVLSPIIIASRENTVNILLRKKLHDDQIALQGNNDNKLTFKPLFN